MSDNSISNSSIFAGENLRFVAWIDISGFKKLMKADPEEALEVIKEFFKIGYWQIPHDNQPQTEVVGSGIDGLFVSDCAIIWTNFVFDNKSHIDHFHNILTIVKKINEECLQSEIMKRNRMMLSTSIAFGTFFQIKTVDHEYIIKNMIFGQAYIDAYADNSDNLDPGLCRIVKKNLPDLILTRTNSSYVNDDLFPFVQEDDGKIYFYWNCRSLKEIEPFKNKYRQARERKYQDMFEALNTHN